jgi:hypothetical protein
MTATALTAQMLTDTRRTLASARIDLDAFLACDGAERARRWRAWYTAADRADLVRQMLTRRDGTWTDGEIVRWVAHYDAKYQ